MKQFSILLTLLELVSTPAFAQSPIMVQDFESATDTPTAWTVNIPPDTANVKRTSDQVFEGKQALKLHYRFTSEAAFQYLGIPHNVKILTPIQKLQFQLFGDNSGCSYGLQLTDASGETHQFGSSSGLGGNIDFTGWREVAFAIDSPHETWGGDTNKKLDYPITRITLTVGQPVKDGKNIGVESDLFFDALRVESGKSREQTLGSQIAVTSPAYGANIKGKTRIAVHAPGFKKLTAKCWKQGKGFGADALVATVMLNEKGDGDFVFPADTFPHGPITVRISGTEDGLKDNCYLQLYNGGGISWNEGTPKAVPPGAKGLKLIFADDFNGPLSISSTDPKARYYDHKPPKGTQDFSVHPFTGHESPNTPFAQKDTYLRIRASDKARSAGLLSSLKNDGTGIKASLPCYFECRFLGPNAIGTWPAFWLMTDYITNNSSPACDELDIIEAYGGEGPGAPNADDTYMITPHSWNQGEAGKVMEAKAFASLRNPTRMQKFGIPSTWFESFHTYGCKVTETDTIYYCDNIEVGRHATLAISKQQPLFFMINLATGGGWPVDLSRYNGQADMYVDYVRVYGK